MGGACSSSAKKQKKPTENIPLPPPPPQEVNPHQPLYIPLEPKSPEKQGIIVSNLIYF